MCIAEPGRVLSIADETALVAIRGSIRNVPLTVLTAQDIAVEPGDHVLVHTGLAVAVLTRQEAAALTSLLRQGEVHENA